MQHVAEARSPGITVVSTVLDDSDGLATLFAALRRQQRLPDEVIVVDAGSSDGTRELIAKEQSANGLDIRVIDAPGVNISKGRNIGIGAARSDWIACTDAGCAPSPRWLAAIDEARHGVDFVAGIYVVAGETPFEQALSMSVYPSPDELHDPGVLVRVSHRLFGRNYEARRATGRSMAFSRRAWETAGGFPEHLYTGEDVAFSAAVIDRGFKHVLATDAAVAWRPRQTWAANARLFWTYARGDVRSASTKRQLLRLGVYAAAPVLVLRGGTVGRTLVVSGVAANLALPLARAAKRRLPLRHWWQVPSMVVVKDLAQITGSAVGALDALRGRAQPSGSQSGARRRTR